jgi:hypothetical protein
VEIEGQLACHTQHIPADPTWELVAWGIQKLRPRLWTTGLGHFEMLNIDHQTESNPSNFLGGLTHTCLCLFGKLFFPFLSFLLTLLQVFLASG